MNESGCKSNKIWLGKAIELYNRSMKSWVQGNYIEMYSTRNEGESVVAERFIRTLKNKIYKYMSSISENVYIDKLDNIFNKYNNTYHRTIKVKPVDVKSSTYIDFGIENNEKDPKFKIGDHVRISQYKNIFAKGYTPNWSELVFVIKNVKNNVPWKYAISDFNMSNGKVIIIHLMVGLKKILLHKMSYFREPFTNRKNKIKVGLNLSGYVIKSDLKNATGVDTLKFAKEEDQILINKILVN